MFEAHKEALVWKIRRTISRKLRRAFGKRERVFVARMEVLRIREGIFDFRRRATPSRLEGFFAIRGRNDTLMFRDRAQLYVFQKNGQICVGVLVCRVPRAFRWLQVGDRIARLPAMRILRVRSRLV